MKLQKKNVQTKKIGVVVRDSQRNSVSPKQKSKQTVAAL